MRIEKVPIKEMEVTRQIAQNNTVAYPNGKVQSDTKMDEIIGNNHQIDKEELKRIIEEIRKKMDYLNKYLRIDIDNELDIPVIKIVEKDTEKVIRQIPPDYMLSIMKRIDEMLGIIINERI